MSISRRMFRIMIGLALVGLFAPLLAACGPVAPAAPAEIVLGTALPLTGGQAREGGYLKKG